MNQRIVARVQSRAAGASALERRDPAPGCRAISSTSWAMRITGCRCARRCMSPSLRSAPGPDGGHDHRRARARGERRGVRARAPDFLSAYSEDGAAGARARARLRRRQLLFRRHAGAAAGGRGAKSSNFASGSIGGGARRRERGDRGGRRRQRAGRGAAACSAIEMSADPPKTRLMPTSKPMAQAAVPGKPGENDAAEDEIDDAAQQQASPSVRKAMPVLERHHDRGNPLEEQEHGQDQASARQRPDSGHSSSTTPATTPHDGRAAATSRIPALRACARW